MSTTSSPKKRTTTKTSDSVLHFVDDLPEVDSFLFGEYRILYRPEHLHWLKERLALCSRPVAVDLETWSAPDAPIGTEEHYRRAVIALTAISAGSELRAVVVHLLSELPPREWFLPLLEHVLVMHNADYDLHFIHRETGRIPDRVIDTMVLFGLLLAGRSHTPKGKTQQGDVHGVSLEDAFGRYSELPLPKAVRQSFYGSELGLVLGLQEVRYAITDAVATEYVLYQMLREIHEEGLERVAELETALVPIVYRMNAHGIHIDLELLERYKQYLQELADRYQQELVALLRQDRFTVVGPLPEGVPDLGPQLGPEEEVRLRGLRCRRLLKNRPGLRLCQLFDLPSQEKVTLYADLYQANLRGESPTVEIAPADFLKFNSSEFWGRYLHVLTATAVRNSSAEQLGVFINAYYSHLLDSADLPQTQLAVQVCEQLLRYRKVMKILSSFIQPWMERGGSTGRITTRFQQTRTDTGRFSSNNPNMQNVPRPDKDVGVNMRDVVKAPDGYLLVTADYSQYELRVAAQLAHEPTMIRIYQQEWEIRQRIERILQERYGLFPFDHDRIAQLQDPELTELQQRLAELDLHRYNASLIFHKPQDQITKEERTQAKVVSFGVLYGMQAESLSQRLRADLGSDITVDEARELLERYFSSFPALRQYIQRTGEWALHHGYVTTPLGRKRWVVLPNRRVMEAMPLPKSYEAEIERIKREMVNATIQSVNADATKLAMLLLHRRLESDPDIDLDTEYIILTVHDEIVVQVRERNARRVAQYVMESMLEASRLAGLTEVPTVVEVTISRNWSK